MKDVDELLNKIDAYDKKTRDDYEKKLREKEYELKVWEDTVKNLSDDIRDIIKIARKLGAIGHEKAYKIVKDFEGNGITHRLGFKIRSYIWSEKTVKIDDFLVEYGGGACGKYAIEVYEDGHIEYYDELKERTYSSLINRIAYVKKMPERIHEIKYALIKFVEAL